MNKQAELLPPESEEDVSDRGRKMDTELRIMGTMLRLLDELPTSAQARVVAWLSSRFMESLK